MLPSGAHDASAAWRAGAPEGDAKRASGEIYRNVLEVSASARAPAAPAQTAQRGAD